MLGSEILRILLYQCSRFLQFVQCNKYRLSIRQVPEFIDPVFTKTSPKRSFSLNRKRAFWLVFVKTGSIISGKEIEIRISRLVMVTNSVDSVADPGCSFYSTE